MRHNAVVLLLFLVFFRLSSVKAYKSPIDDNLQEEKDREWNQVIGNFTNFWPWFYILVLGMIFLSFRSHLIFPNSIWTFILLFYLSFIPPFSVMTFISLFTFIWNLILTQIPIKIASISFQIFFSILHCCMNHLRIL